MLSLEEIYKNEKFPAVIGKAFVTLLPLITISVVIQKFGDQFFEHFNSILIFISLGSVLYLPGISKFYLRGGKSDSRHYFSLTLLSLITVIFGAGIAYSVNRYFDLVESSTVLSISALIIFLRCFSFWRDFLIGRNKAIYVVSADALSEIFIVIFLMTYDLQSMNFGVDYLVLLIFMPKIILNILGTIFVCNFLNRQNKVSRDKITKDEILSSCLIYLTNEIGNQSERLIILFYLGSPELAAFVISQKIPDVLKTGLSYVRTLFISDLAQLSYDKALKKKFEKISVLVIALIICSLPFQIILLYILYPSFMPNTWTFMILGILSIIIGQKSQLNFALIRSRSLTHPVMVGNLFSVALRIFGSIVLIQLFNIYGACVNLILYRLINIKISEAILQKYREHFE